MLRNNDAERLKIDIKQCQVHAELIRKASDLTEKLAAVFSANKFATDVALDPDLMIYSGGFFSPDDRRVMNEIRDSQPEELVDFELKAKDSRLTEMLFRYRGRNFPEILSVAEKQQWQLFCRNRLSGGNENVFLGFTEYREQIAELRQQEGVDIQLLDSLEQYADKLQKKLK